jgi:hypothetical protein
MPADTHQARIGIMFNIRPTALPGFRVGLPDEDELGFNVANDGLTPPVLPGAPDVPPVDDNYPFGTTSFGFTVPQRPGPNPLAPPGNGSPLPSGGNPVPTDLTPLGPLGFGGPLNFARYVPANPTNQAEPASEPSDPLQKASGGTDFSPIGSAQAQTPQPQQPGTSLKIDPSPGEAVALPDGSTIPDQKSSTGKLMSPKADLSEVAAAGRQVGSTYRAMLTNPEGAAAAFPYLVTQLGLNVAQWGNFDYQRQGNAITGGIHLPKFVHVSNFNVGLFCQQAGLSLDDTLQFAGTYACLRSKNSDPNRPHCLNAEQLEYITAGYKTGQSGIFDPSERTR